MKVKRTSGGKAVYELEVTIISDFKLAEHSILLNLDFLAGLKQDLGCADISYSAIFDSTVLKKIESDEFQNSINNFVDESNSNGLAEGTVNMIKVIKRIMYGRCCFDTLRIKSLRLEKMRKIN